MPLTERDRRTLTVGGIIAGVLLIGFLLVNILSGGGETPPASQPRPTSTGSPSTAPTPSPTKTPEPVFQGRDPFSVPGVLAPSSGSSSGTGSSSSSGTGSSSSSSSGSSSSTGTTSP